MAWQTHALLRWGGTLGGDTWSCGVRMRGDTPGADPATFAADSLEDAADVISTSFQLSQMRYSGLARLTWVKLNSIGTDGRYSEPTTNLFEFGGAGVSPSSSVRTPPQLAHVVSLTTDKRRGRAHIGRIFVPTSANVVEPDGRLTQAEAESMVQAARTFINDLNGLGALNPFSVAVFSGLGAEVETVTGVRVGRVIDTQQRRRRQLDESYSAVAL